MLLCLAVGTWSDWVYTVKKPTGSWAVSITGDMCPSSVMDIECQRADGSSAQRTGQVIHCKERVGVYCRNSEQTGDNEICADYRFRFLCASIEKPREYFFQSGFRLFSNINRGSCLVISGSHFFLFGLLFSFTRTRGS